MSTKPVKAINQADITPSWVPPAQLSAPAAPEVPAPKPARTRIVSKLHEEDKAASTLMRILGELSSDAARLRVLRTVRERIEEISRNCYLATDQIQSHQISNAISAPVANWPTNDVHSEASGGIVDAP